MPSAAKAAVIAGTSSPSSAGVTTSVRSLYVETSSGSTTGGRSPGTPATRRQNALDQTAPVLQPLVQALAARPAPTAACSSDIRAFRPGNAQS